MHVKLSEGKCLPWDRRWAVAHEMAKIDFDDPEWASCNNFSIGAKAPELQAITARCDMPYQKVTLSHPRLKDLTISPDLPADHGAFIQWIMPIVPKHRALPSRIVRAEGRGMTDTDYPSVSIINLASHREVAARVDGEYSHLRWRGNFILDGLSPWEEMSWIGQKIRLGLAELEIVEPIVRCKATCVSPETGQSDADTLTILKENWDHQYMGVYARVIKTGDIRQGDQVERL